MYKQFLILKINNGFNLYEVQRNKNLRYIVSWNTLLACYLTAQAEAEGQEFHIMQCLLMDERMGK